MKFKFFTAPNPNDPSMMVSVEGGGMLAMHMMMLAANILEFCQRHDPKEYAELQYSGGRKGSTYWKGSLLILKTESGNAWADNGYLNAFLFQVQYLYEAVNALVNQPEGYNKQAALNSASIPIIVKALETFQEWKTKEIKEAKRLHGHSNWGDATGWNKMDWSDQNQTLLKLLQR